MSRWLVTGASGMVGGALCEALASAGETAGRVTRQARGSESFEWDLEQGDAPREVQNWNPDIIVHAAAYTSVDDCEKDPDRAARINVDGTARVARLALARGARLIYLSTDSVFDGRRGGYRDDDSPNPLNVYATTKLAGERRAALVGDHAILRFNVIGPQRLAWWILGAGEAGRPIDVYEDVRFNPVEVRDLAQLLILLGRSPLRGLFHAGCQETLSKAEFARRLVDAAGFADRAAMRSVELGSAQRGALRPLDTSLTPSAAIRDLMPIPLFDNAIRRLAAEYPRGAI